MLQNLQTLKELLLKIGKDNTWKMYYEKKNIMMFWRASDQDKVFLHVYLAGPGAVVGRMKIVTCLKHPNYGTTCLERNRMSISDARKIFRNPREHNMKGTLI